MSTAQPDNHNDRILIASLDNQFADLHRRYCSLICSTAEADLYRQTQPTNGRTIASVGECVLRGAAVIEQTFGGITANLWDDPFEWTLPENLSTVNKVIEYLEEVAATRQAAFASFSRDADLLKEVMVPAAGTRVLFDLLTETLVKSAVCYGRAAATSSLLPTSPPGSRSESTS